MTPTRSFVSRIHPSLLAISLSCLIVGCGAAPIAVEEVSSTHMTPTAVTAQVVRSGRYNLVEVVADTAQRDLLQQIVDVTAPRALPATVADMLRYVLLRSGFSVCAGEVLAHFDALPLPAAHFHVGPIPLRDALALVAGPAWRLTVDHAARQVCFVPSDANLGAEP